ncbi:MAG TPA: branched-chain amino acid aminotransferase [Flavobacteriales bacterium]|nr:branched-chain amino acid aminotransferase [Flavobacteriales bacterium]HPH81384.1 branched-chain amino acid aminotransferase [Flavobacteriales bacterium]
MSYEITITRASHSKIGETDIDHIPMGICFTDHMFVCDYHEGTWQNPRIEPLAPIPTHPSAMALHYGQAIFEGMKVTRGKNGTPILFRPYENAKRLNFSADRMAMPHFPETLFVEALKMLVDIERQWIPTTEGSALYLRPFMYADESYTGMRAATSYKFIIFATPAGPYFNRRIRLYAETKFIRAANGGTGEAKAAGNYGAAIRPTEIAKANGYDQVLWLDATHFENIMEVGTMNIFFKINGKFITPILDGSVLAGITRSSVIDLLRYKGYEVYERTISMKEILEASENNSLEEAFGTGTAVGIAMIEEIGYKNLFIHLPAENPVATMVNETINRIKVQEEADPFGWTIPVLTN